MKFGKMQNLRFGTNNGAYSVVTQTENEDSQITLTDYEAELVTSHFGKENLHVGNVHSDKSLSAKIFKKYPSGEHITLNVVFPKPNKTELRLYLSSKAKFKPVSGDIWFMFVKNNQIWIGANNEHIWRDEASGLKRDDSDDIYQNIVNDENLVRIDTLKPRDIYRRSRKVAIKRLELSNFTCDFDTNHGLFESRFSKKPYLEVHHLIPMALQKDFTKSLDTIHNVFCLCPRCHRAVHHAEKILARKILGHLATTRDVLNRYSLSTDELFRLYAVESID